jgi:hypothetical protein
VTGSASRDDENYSVWKNAGRISSLPVQNKSNVNATKLYNSLDLLISRNIKNENYFAPVKAYN